MLILMHASVAGAYLFLAAWALRRLRRFANPVGASAAWVPLAEPGQPGTQMPWAERLALLGVWLAHGAQLGNGLFRDQGIQLGFAMALSATMWLAMAVYWIESLIFDLGGMRVLILPIAAFCSVLPLIFPGAVHALPANNAALGFHLVVALAAYSMFTIAAFHALLMTALDRSLHGHFVMEDGGGVGQGSHQGPNVWRRILLGSLPPLMTMERLLFRLLFVGFTLLTLTLASGFIFSEAVTGRAVVLDHKTVFALISWCIFFALLVGRTWYGWRGRVALRWTLAGFVTMLLAYVGTRFVLEVILRRW